MLFGGLALVHALGCGLEGGQPPLDGGDVADLLRGVSSPRRPRRRPLALRLCRATPALW